MRVAGPGNPIGKYVKENSATAKAKRTEVLVSRLLASLGVENDLMPHRHSYDIKLRDGHRVDVKSSRPSLFETKTARYSFTLAHHSQGDYADFFVLVAVDDDKRELYLFVLPTKDAPSGALGFLWPARRPSQWHKYQNRFDLLGADVGKLDMALKELSEKFFSKEEFVCETKPVLAKKERELMSDLQVIERTSLKDTLPAWCDEHGISITEFAEKMGYTYAHAWGVLRGKVPASVTIVGQFVLAFGLEAARELLDMAGVAYGYRVVESELKAEPVMVAEVDQ